MKILSNTFNLRFVNIFNRIYRNYKVFSLSLYIFCIPFWFHLQKFHLQKQKLLNEHELTNEKYQRSPDKFNSQRLSQRLDVFKLHEQSHYPGGFSFCLSHRNENIAVISVWYKHIDSCVAFGMFSFGWHAAGTASECYCKSSQVELS